MLKSGIEHVGVVVESLNEIVKVKIISESACASCHIKGACNASDMEEKIVDVPCQNGSYKLGQKVLLSMNQELGFTALFYAYILPFILLFIVLVVSSRYMNELYAGLLSIAVLVPYYATIYFATPYFRKKFTYLLKSL